MDGYLVFQLCEALSCGIPKMLHSSCGKPKLVCDFFFFSEQCNFIGAVQRYFSWLISFWILEKFLFIKPDYGYILYYWYKVYYRTSTIFLEKKIMGRRNTIL